MNPIPSTASEPPADLFNLAVYRKANSQLPPLQPGEKRVVFIGDSIIDFWDFNRDFPGEGWINRGIAGQRTVEILGRFCNDALALHPQVIFVIAGTNDLATDGTVDVIIANLREMVRLSVQQGIRIIVSSLLPVSDYHKEKEAKFERTKTRPPKLILATNQAIAAMAVQEGAVYLDLHHCLEDSAGFLHADFGDDGLHPNEAGYKAITSRVLYSIRNSMSSSL